MTLAEARALLARVGKPMTVAQAAMALGVSQGAIRRAVAQARGGRQ